MKYNWRKKAKEMTKPKNRSKEDGHSIEPKPLKMIRIKCKGETFQEADERNKCFYDEGWKDGKASALKDVEKIIDNFLNKDENLGLYGRRCFKNLKQAIKEQLK